MSVMIGAPSTPFSCGHSDTIVPATAGAARTPAAQAPATRLRILMPPRAPDAIAISAPGMARPQPKTNENPMSAALQRPPGTRTSAGVAVRYQLTSLAQMLSRAATVFALSDLHQPKPL